MYLVFSIGVGLKCYEQNQDKGRGWEGRLSESP